MITFVKINNHKNQIYAIATELTFVKASIPIVNSKQTKAIASAAQ